MGGESPVVIFGKGIDLPVGDKTYTFMPLRMKEWAELEEYLRVKRCSVAMQVLVKMGLSLHDQTKKLAYMSGMSFEPGEVETACGKEPDVGLRMVWLSIRRSQPDLTFEAFEEEFLSLSDEERGKFTAAIQGLSTTGDPQDADDTSDPTTCGPTTDGQSEQPPSASTTPATP